MTEYMTITVDSYAIAREMTDSNFSYEVLSELAQQFEGDSERFVDRIFKNIFDNEDDTLLNFLETIVKQFAHLKEENNA